MLNLKAKALVLQIQGWICNIKQVMLLSLVMNFIYVSDKLFGVKIVGISNLKSTLVLCFSFISSIFSVFLVSLARSLHQ